MFEEEKAKMLGTGKDTPQEGMAPKSKAHKQGHADGIFRRGMTNPFSPYTNCWHGYNAGYLQGYTANIDTTCLLTRGYERGKGDEA